MSNTLSGLTPAQTFQGLIKVGNNTNVDGTAKVLSDGSGNDLPMEVSTTGVNFTGTVTQNGSPITTNPSGVAGAIQFSDGSAFASDASNLFWDDTNNRLGIGTNTPTAKTHIKGSGTTAATTALLVQNSVGSEKFKVRDDGNIYFTGFLEISGSSRKSGYSRTGGYGIFGTTLAADSSAVLQADSTTQGFLPPRMTTTQRDAIATPATGLKVYNTTTNTTDTYDGATWQRFGQQTLIKGSGTTSATTSLLVQNSSGTELFKVNDVGDLFFNGLETSSMRIHTLGNLNKGISIDNEIDMGAFYGITFKTWDGSAYSNFMRINGNTASRGLIIGGTTNDASAKLQIDSTTQGFLPPKMTTTQKNAISSPASGLMVYDTDTNKLCCYNGTSWNDLF